MKQEISIEKFFKLIEPIVIGNNLELYHIEYIKEAGENYLRIYIDRPEGITFEDCEKVSRAVSEILDIEDPIQDFYYLEVSSPGIDRILYTDNHLQKYIGSKVVIKLSKLFEGKKVYEGNLISFSAEDIIINSDDIDISISRENIRSVSLKGEF